MKLLTLNTHKGFSALNRRFILHELREAIRLLDNLQHKSQSLRGSSYASGTTTLGCMKPA